MNGKMFLRRIKTVGCPILTLAAVVIFIFTAIDLACTPNATAYFIRTSVWRMVSCGYIAIVFPFLAMKKRGKGKDDTND